MGFPDEMAPITWDELKVDTHLRTVVTQEVEDHLAVLETSLYPVISSHIRRLKA